MAQKPNLPQFTGDAKTWAQQLVSQLDPYFARLQGEQTEGPLLPRFTQATLPDAGKYAASGANGYSRLVWVEDATPDGGQLYYSDGTDWHAVVDQETLANYVATVLAGYVQSVTAGAGVDVDNTDPQNPIVSNTGVLSVSGSDLIEVDNTDPQNPEVGRKAIAHIGLNKSINNADSPGEALLCGFDSSGAVDPLEPFKWRAGNSVYASDPTEINPNLAGSWYIMARSDSSKYGGIRSAVAARPLGGGAWTYRYYYGGTVTVDDYVPSSVDWLIGEVYLEDTEVVSTGYLYEVAKPALGRQSAVAGASMAPVGMVLVRQTIVQGISNSVTTAIAFDEAIYDTHDVWDGATSATDIVVPAGVYAMRAVGQVTLGSAATGTKYLSIENMSRAESARSRVRVAAPEWGGIQAVQPLTPCSPGDKIQMRCYHNSGGTLNTVPSGSSDQVWLEVQWFYRAP